MPARGWLGLGLQLSVQRKLDHCAYPEMLTCCKDTAFNGSPQPTEALDRACFKRARAHRLVRNRMSFEYAADRCGRDWWFPALIGSCIEWRVNLDFLGRGAI